MGTKLKRYVTSDKFMLESKGEKRYEANNLNNYVINSNDDCIKDDDRRIYMRHVSVLKKGDTEYWDNIGSNCFTDEVGSKVDVSTFHAQTFPTTQSKLDLFAKRLSSVEKFLKFQYVLYKRKINASISELLEEYKAYCLDHSLKPIGKIAFNRKMTEFGFKYTVTRVNKTNTTEFHMKN